LITSGSFFLLFWYLAANGFLEDGLVLTNTDYEIINLSSINVLLSERL